MRLLTIVTMTAFLLAACSDDSVKPPPDTKATIADKGTTSDKSSTTKELSTAPTEGGTKKDGTSAGPADCKTIAECQKPCGIDTTCISTCLNKGCESGKTAMNALTACVMSQCIADCVTGYNQKCDDCSKAKCTTQYNACQSHTC